MKNDKVIMTINQKNIEIPKELLEETAELFFKTNDLNDLRTFVDVDYKKIQDKNTRKLFRDIAIMDDEPVEEILNEYKISKEEYIKKLLELFKEGKVTVELEELGEDFLRFTNNDVYLETLAETPEELKENISYLFECYSGNNACQEKKEKILENFLEIFKNNKDIFMQNYDENMGLEY